MQWWVISPFIIFAVFDLSPLTFWTNCCFYIYSVIKWGDVIIRNFKMPENCSQCVAISCVRKVIWPLETYATYP